MNRKLQLFFKYYLPAILWMGVIFYFSGVPDIKVGADSLTWEILLRKAAHVGEYVILAWLIFRIIHLGHNYERKDSFIVAVLAVLAYAISDELHQTFVPDRTGKVIDVIVDILGGTLGLGIIVFFYGALFSLRKLFFIAALSVTLVFSVNAVIREGELVAGQKSLEEELQKKNEILEENLTNNASTESQNDLEKSNQEKDISLPSEIPSKVRIDVPFTSQAPLLNWDEYHEEACEEASLIMIKFFLDKKDLNPQIADREILDMINFEIKNYGDYKDSTVSQMIGLVDDFYGGLPGGKKLKIIYDIKRQDIKNYLAKGNPIIIPAAGRLLGNPYYTQPGPLFHVLVLTGYEGDQIITNDPGTKQGKNYRYNINVLYNAIHDFPGNKENIENGRKAMIVME